MPHRVLWQRVDAAAALLRAAACHAPTWCLGACWHRGSDIRLICVSLPPHNRAPFFIYTTSAMLPPSLRAPSGSEVRLSIGSPDSGTVISDSPDIRLNTGCASLGLRDLSWREVDPAKRSNIHIPYPGRSGFFLLLTGSAAWVANVQIGPGKMEAGDHANFFHAGDHARTLRLLPLIKPEGNGAAPSRSFPHLTACWQFGRGMRALAV